MPALEHPLFTAAELGDSLHSTVTESAAVSAERRVWGWLKPVLKLDERPEEIPDEVWSWAIELGCIAHENPAGLKSYQLGPQLQQFSAERRAEILDEAGNSGNDDGGTGQLGDNTPLGTFPAPMTWPCGFWQ